MTQKQIILNNLLINYYTEGTGGAPIIFLHGWRSEALVWHSIIKNLKLRIENYALYALDLPGFGNSEMPKNPFTLHDYAKIVKEFIGTLNPPHFAPQDGASWSKQPLTLNPIIIGHSFGARIAIKLAAENPTLIQKLVLVGSGGARPWWRHIGMCIAKFIKPFFIPRFMQPFREKLYRIIGAEDYVATPKLKKTVLNILHEPLEPLFPRIQTPTIIIWGEKDAVTPLAYGQKIHRDIHDSHFVIIKNAGHFCFLEQPEEFIKILEEFLKK